MDRVAEQEKVCFLRSRSKEEKNELIMRILEALNSYLIREPAACAYFQSAADSSGKTLIPEDSYVFYVPLPPEKRERKAVFIHVN